MNPPVTPPPIDTCTQTIHLVPTPWCLVVATVTIAALIVACGVLAALLGALYIHLTDNDQ